MKLSELAELFVGMMAMVIAGALGVKLHDPLVGGLVGGGGGIIIEHTVHRVVRRLLRERAQIVDRLTRSYMYEFRRAGGVESSGDG